MRAREDLQTLLTDILGSNQVYFQPPESVKMKYPAIVYELNNTGTIHADNRAYHHTRSYQVQFITYDPNPDSTVNTALLELPLCRFEKHNNVSNLHHYVYTLYF